MTMTKADRYRKLLIAMFCSLTLAGLLASRLSIPALCWAVGWQWAVTRDLSHREIPGLACLLVLAALLPGTGRVLTWSFVLTGLIPGAVFLLLSAFGVLDMGGGDIKLILAGGVALGLYAAVLAVTAAFAILLVYALIKKKKKPVGRVPLAPFLYIGFFPLGVFGLFAW